MSDLKRAIHFLLFDNIDVYDLEESDEDSAFIKRIAWLSEEQYSKNETCIFKNYSLEDRCPFKEKQRCNEKKCVKDCAESYNDMVIQFYNKCILKEGEVSE